jgi:hypothetical protein
VVGGARVGGCYRERWLTTSAIGRPMQKMWMISWARKALAENSRFGAAERGTTIRLITR